ncbi:MAG: class I SAM-dependent methyltransferase [Pseudomonadota bacterium]
MSGGTDSGFEYSGVENLESMLAARNYNAWLTDTVSRNLSGARVLDFGAGQGLFARRLRDRGIVVECLEPDVELQRALERDGLRVFSELSAVGNESFDSVYSLNVLEHIENDADALKRLFALLRPGGRLILYVPAFMVLYSEMDRLVGHFRRYRRAGLVDKVTSAGFSVQAVRYVDSLGFFAALAFRCFGDKSGRVSPGAVRTYDRVVFPLSRVLDALTGRLFGKNLLLVARKGRENRT